MRKAFLAAVAVMTSVATAGSTVLVQAGTNQNCAQIKGYVISGGNVNCEDELEKILSGIKTDINNGNLNDCPVIIYPGINKPNDNTSCTNKPSTGESETNSSDVGESETNTSETENPGTNNSGNDEENNVPETNVPGVNVPETSKPDVEEGTTAASGETEDKSFAEQVVDLVNQERAKAGLEKLTLDKNIEAAALVRAKEIEVSFSHTRPDGSSFSSVLKEHNISYRGAGENIAWGQTSPEAVMNAWMNSEGHRANILNANFTKIGVGYYQNSAGRKFWTQLFTY